MNINVIRDIDIRMSEQLGKNLDIHTLVIAIRRKCMPKDMFASVLNPCITVFKKARDFSKQLLNNTTVFSAGGDLFNSNIPWYNTHRYKLRRIMAVKRKLFCTICVALILMFACLSAHAETVYTITYDLNGGDGYAPSVSVNNGEAIRITNQTPWLNPQTFMGWSTTKNEQAGEYLPGDIFHVDSDTTLYAVWRDAPDPGIVEAGKTYRIESYHLTNQAYYNPRMYVKIVVASSGYYTLQSTSAPLQGSFWGGQGFYDSELDMISEFDEINNGDDFSVTAWLDGGETYYLAYMDFFEEDMTFICTESKIEDLRRIDLVLPQQLTTINNSAFENGSFHSVLIPSQVQSIGGYAFAGCTKLTEVYITEAVVDIAEEAFINCSPSLTLYGLADSSVSDFAEVHGYHFEDIRMLLNNP